MNKFFFANYTNCVRSCHTCNAIWILLVMLLGETNAFSYDFKVNDFYYNYLNNNGVEVTYGDTPYKGTVSIPNSVIYNGETYNVISIGSNAFQGCTGLTEVIIPNSVTIINDYAFYICTGLISINISNSVTRIGSSAFSSCGSLSSISIPNSVTSIGDFAFLNCTGLTNLSLGSSINSIGFHAFYGCTKLTSVTIPNSVKNIDDGTFEECQSLITVVSKIESPFSILTSVFNNISENATLQVPFGTKNKYLSYVGWYKHFNEIIELNGLCYNLTISSTDHGTIYFNNQSIRNSSQSFSIEEGSPATISFLPDNGYRVASVKVNNTDVTAQVSNNQYVISNITTNTTVAVTFEEIQQTTFKVSITASGNGTVYYYTTTAIRNQTCTFTEETAISTVLLLYPDNGNRIASLKVDNTDVTSSINNNQYKISITKDTNIEAVFEAIPSTDFTMTIKTNSLGYIKYFYTTDPSPGADHTEYNGTVTSEYSRSVVKGGAVTLTFYPNDGCELAKLMVNGVNVTTNVTNHQYSISNITSNLEIIASFEDSLEPKQQLDGHDYVDLGLPSGKLWAATNYGASKPEDYGNYVTWNETDIIPSSWGTSWITPTLADIKELESNCTWTWESLNGVYGYTIKGKNGNTIFLPAAGAKVSKTYHVGEWVYYWTSMKDPSYDNMVYIILATSSSVAWGSQNKDMTYLPIRPVSKDGKEAPPAAYTLSITVSGYGSATYNGTATRNQTRSFTINEGTNATIIFTPDNGYRIASVKVNNTDVTSKVQNNQYTVSNITANTTVSVSFEAIPQTTYTLSITASGYGSATYNGTSARNQTRTFTVNEGSSATISFSPDNGYRIASVKVNNADVTGASVTSNRYTISNINANTTVSVTFEAIPPTTHSLSIKVSGNGYVLYNDTYFRNKTNYYTVSHGSSETIAINPDVGYRLSNMKVNNKDVTSNVMDNSYTITNITADTNVEVTFEEIPPTTFSLSITASGNGSATYNGTSARNQTRTFTVNEGSSATVSFTPDNGYSIGSVKVNNTDVTANVTNNQYTVNNILTNTSVSVTFADIEYDNLSNNGVNYRVVSNPNKTVSVANGSYGYWLTVPASFTANGFEWSVTGIDNDVISDNPQLAAFIWNPSTQFTASVNNPNFLLYVTSSQYAPSSIKNVVVGNTANSITLTDASSGNNFYCPREFTARSISYSHSYGMTTGISEARGWESISLPFDVEAITHSSKGTLVPFANWQEGGSTKPFWLYQLGSNGFTEASSIKANTPYIISMPNNSDYKEEYRVNGVITFSSTDVTVKSSESLQNGTYGDRTFVPNFINQDANSGFYVLNAVNNYSANSSGYAEGSRFVRNLRTIHPFEAYIASANNAKESFPIFEDTPTWIQLIENSKLIMDRVYNLSGQQVKIEGDQNYGSLKKGIYIVNGKKIVIR